MAADRRCLDARSFYDNSGFLTETLATQYGALVVFAEHRYYGLSQVSPITSLEPNRTESNRMERELIDRLVGRSSHLVTGRSKAPTRASCRSSKRWRTMRRSPMASASRRREPPTAPSLRSVAAMAACLLLGFGSSIPMSFKVCRESVGSSCVCGASHEADTRDMLE